MCTWPSNHLRRDKESRSLGIWTNAINTELRVLVSYSFIRAKELPGREWGRKKDHFKSSWPRNGSSPGGACPGSWHERCLRSCGGVPADEREHSWLLGTLSFFSSSAGTGDYSSHYTYRSGHIRSVSGAGGDHRASHGYVGVGILRTDLGKNTKVKTGNVSYEVILGKGPAIRWRNWCWR